MTEIYGASDDLIEVEGDVTGEHGCWDQDTILECSDGTQLLVHYGKMASDHEIGVWSLTLVVAGTLFLGIDECFDDEADPYSDVARFDAGLTSVRAARWAKDCRQTDWVEVL